MTLTDTRIRTATVPKVKKQTKLFDGGGLHLLVNASGKYWKLDYRIDGRRRTLSIGVYPAISLKEARKKRDDAKALILQGVDPSHKNKIDKMQARIQKDGTFKHAAKLWLDHAGSEWTEKTRNIAQTWLDADVFPTIGTTQLDNIEPPDVLMILRKVEATGHAYKLRRLHSYINRIFSFSISHGICKQNPASALIARDLFGKYKRKNRPAFTTVKEVGQLMRMICGYDGTTLTRNALHLLALVFVRPGELIAMRWADVDLERKQWRYLVTKTNTPHAVPLSSQALAILEETRAITGQWEYVFPGERSKHRHMSNNTLNAALRYIGIDTKTQHCAHGFRAMARTLLAEQGCNKEYIERQLCHKQGDDTVAAYAREKHLPERIIMMQSWADYLDALRDGADVIPINSRSAAG